ncbi:S24 family peptidase [Sphingobium yanoikuyae]|uniref:S24 family peptidase n=1 Tax=Sphingobium yanoikuyae TaxID=13690 RepID=UPI003F0AC03A
MSKKTTGEVLASLRDRSGLTLAEIAAAAGYRGPSSVQAMFSPEYNMSPLSWAVGNKLARALVGKGNPPITLSEVHRLCYTDEQWNPTTPPARTTLEDPMQTFRDLMEAGRNNPQPLRTKDIPVFGTALAADIAFEDDGTAYLVEQTVFEMGEIILYGKRPAGIPANSEAYALYVAGSSMEPRYRPGDPLFVDPKRPPAIGDDVVVQLRSETGGDVEITAGLIKTLARRTGSYLELEQYQPAIRFRVPMERVAHIHRVIPPKELFGF